MHNSCIKYPEQYIGFSLFNICLLSNFKEIGYASFKGFNKSFPEIWYGINDECQGNGYETEAIKALGDWEFKMPDAVAIEVEAEISNIKSDRLLTKVGFVEQVIWNLKVLNIYIKKRNTILKNSYKLIYPFFNIYLLLVTFHPKFRKDLPNFF